MQGLLVGSPLVSRPGAIRERPRGGRASGRRGAAGRCTGLFGEPASLAEWGRIQQAYASRLLPVELGRVIDRARLDGELDDEQVEQLHGEARRVLRSIEVLALSERVLDRAAGPMPTGLGTLDALHLATALELAAVGTRGLVLATHDRQLARAARASGLDVIGA